MKMLSVIVTCALLLTASRLASELKRAGALPASRSAATKVSHPESVKSSTQASLHRANVSSTEN